MNTLKGLVSTSANPKAELDRLRKLANIRLGRTVGVNDPLTDDEVITLMAPAKRGRKKGGKKEERISANNSATKPEETIPNNIGIVGAKNSDTQRRKRTLGADVFMRYLISAGLCAIPVGHGYLLFHDSAELFGRAGEIGGFIYLVFVSVGTFMCFDKRNSSVADIFLWAIGVLDIFAFFVHYEVFSRTLSGLSSFFITVYCIFIVASSFFSLIALRNYDVVEEV
jgi:hypothetical protein